jgi:uncharacterized repeat protein (TIGR01451 family)
MNTFPRFASLRWLIAAALPIMFLFISIVPAAAGDLLQNSNVSVAKTCTPRLVQPGGTVNCTIAITNTGTAARTITLIDIIAGGGLWPSTTSSLGTPAKNVYNRQEYGPHGPAVIAPNTTLSIPVVIRAPSDLGCYRNLTNEVHISDALTHSQIASATTSFSVDCVNGVGLHT